MKKNISVIFFIIMIVFISIYLVVEKNSRIDTLIAKIKNTHKDQIKTAIYQYDISTKFIFESIINNKEVLTIQQKALNSKTIKEQDSYRKVLLNKLTPFYDNLKKFGIMNMETSLVASATNLLFLLFQKTIL